MAAQQDTEPPILKLPAELTEAVADNVDAADLRALKLTCRYLNTNVQRAFTRAHFTEQSFILASPESMQALVDMAKDTVYSKVVRKINLFALKVPKSPPHPHGRYGRRRAADSQPKGDRDTRIQKREMGRLYQQTYEKQDKFWKTRRWGIALCDALQHINASTDGIFINLVNTAAELRSASGVLALESLLGHTDCLAELYSDHAALSTLQDAISNGGCPLVGFRFAEPRTLLAGRDWSVQHHPGLFNDLRTVDIGFRVGQNPIELVATHLGCAPHLEHIIVRTGVCWHANTQYVHVLGAVAELPRLQEVDIIGPYPEPGHLAAFCARYGSTLKRLTISGAPAARYGQAIISREQARKVVEKAWSAAKITGIEFELS
ncbi:hypothetical protein LTR17_003726 [Elasticomyces elasticus]|nr:hypothetical protein LTR17_003726 [Elasticomyces elasticus]